MKDQIAKIIDTFCELTPEQQVEAFIEVKCQLLNLRQKRAEEHAVVAKENTLHAEDIWRGSDVIKNGHPSVEPAMAVANKGF